MGELLGVAALFIGMAAIYYIPLALLVGFVVVCFVFRPDSREQQERIHKENLRRLSDPLWRRK
jgi:NAD/NADP transhydrogenase alpha subunit